MKCLPFDRSMPFLLALALFSGVTTVAPVAAQTVTRGPYLQRGTPDSVVVRWRTNYATDSRVTYGAAPGVVDGQATSLNLATDHAVLLTGLDPATVYYYTVGTTSQTLAGGDAEHYFRTSPVVGSTEPQRIWVLGDSGTADDRARAVRDAYLGYTGNMHTQTWLMLGDNAYSDGRDSEYQRAVFDMYPSTLQKSVLWSTLGNHDGRSASSDSQSGVYYDLFTLPRQGEAGGVASGTEAYYSFDVGNVHYVCLDSYDSDNSPTGPMLTWLENDLASTDQTWIVAFFHHPPYSKGSHDSDSSSSLEEIRQNAVPILEAYGTDLILTGHSHSYERSFLIDGHYGSSSSFDPGTMLIDGGDGRASGDGEYDADGPGAVYIVAGSSGKRSSGDFDHPAMYLGLSELGSLVIDVTGNEMYVVFLRENGAVDDEFTLLKGPPPNAAPVVSAGADLGVVLPASVTLTGSVTDDGLSLPLSHTWSQVSGPGTATFTTPAALESSVSFSLEGTYVLRLLADDGEFTATDDVEVTVYPEGTTNQAPSVSAGPPLTLFVTQTASLEGSYSDDGLPQSMGMTFSWAKISGPGTVVFSNPSSPSTGAIFSLPGAYVLRFSVSDGALSSYADLAVTVEDAPQVFETRIAGSNDDGEERLPGGSISLSSSDLEMISDKGTEQVVALRFGGVSVPQGAQIVEAWVQFQADESSSGTTQLQIEAQASDDAPSLSSSTGDFSARPRTVQSVAWTPAPWQSVGDAGADQRTPNLAPVLQEVVDREGWAEGNALAILLTGSGSRVAESYDGESSAAALLHVEYSLGPPPPNQAPVVAAGADQTIHQAQSVSLAATVSDDGQPSPVTVLWSKVAGPGTVTFQDATAEQTDATFSVNGLYTLRIAAYDGEYTTTDDLTVQVDPPPPNEAPVVSAGPNQMIALPSGASLTASVSDDGQPGPVSVLWTVQSGPGAVTFDDNAASATTAWFAAAGLYTLRITADDGELSSFSELTVDVAPQPPNQPPAVNAGGDFMVALGVAGQLSGSVQDDGLVAPPVTLWSKVSGLGAVVFGDASALSTSATFSAPGDYVLRLTVDDGEFTMSDDVSVEVVDAPTVIEVSIDQSNNDAEERVASGSVSRTSSDLELIDDKGKLQLVGLRFEGVAVPPAATILNAWVQFQVDEVDSGATSLEVRAEKIADAPPITSSAFGLSSRQTTTAVATWSPEPWTAVGNRGIAERTPNLSDVLQEVIDLPSWASGNSVLLLVSGSGKRVADSWDGSSSNAPTLHVEFGFGPPAPNQAPTVDVGTDLSIELTDTVQLVANTSDDGQPGPLTIQWSKVSGPGSVTFSAPASASTNASFSAEGGYVLRAEVSDGELAAFDEVAVTVAPPPPNQAPTVDVGADKNVTLPAHVALSAFIDDDGQPSPVSLAWTMVIGPGTVVFADHTAAGTSVSFSADGVYVLRLTAFDGELSSFDELTVTVAPMPPNQGPTVDVGEDRTVAISSPAVLVATVADDGQPGPLALAWSQVAGPGAATFANPESASTTVVFSAVGDYELRLEADDGEFQVNDELTVTVVSQPTTVEVRVAAGSDDAEEDNPGGSVSVTSSDLEMVEESVNQLVGVRFANLDVPQNATIHTAWVQFVADETDSVVTDLSIRIENVGSAAPFSSSNGDLSSRALSTLAVSWSPEPWTSVGAAGSAERTTELKTLLQTVVSRSDWVSGNAVAFLIDGTGKRTADSYEGGSEKAPLLHVEYTTGPPPPNQPPVVFAGTDQTVSIAQSLTLAGSVSDDGRETPVVLAWSQVGGPGTATFTSPDAETTGVSFPIDGTYVLRLSADDGEFTVSDDVEVVVEPLGPNQAPVVAAGADAVVGVGVALQLQGSASDDGQPGPIAVSWSLVSGPASVTFGTPNQLSTDATFGTSGTFVIRLTASDGELDSSDDMTVEVVDTPQTFEVRVSTGADDAEETLSDGSMNVTSSDLEMIDDGAVQLVGMRFQGVAIPPGATIINAWIQFQADEVNSEATSLTFEAHDTGSAPGFTTSDGNISSRPRTQAAVVWNPAPWQTKLDAGPAQQTPNLAPVVQSVVSRPDWVSGNAIAFVVTGTGKRVADSYNGSSSGAPLLHIEYSTSSGRRQRIRSR